MRWPWWTRKPKLAVVLSGGGTRGAFEVGVIDVFARRGIVPDVLIGTSVGAINAAFWALRPAADVGAQLLDFWLKSSTSTLLPDGPLPMVGRLFQRRDHLTTQAGLQHALRSVIPESVCLEDAPIPLAITSTDAERGERVVIRRGPMLPALLASSAIPGVWPPVEIDGRRLMDGGVVANCDLESAVEAGVTDVIAVDVMSATVRNTSLDVRGIVERTMEIALRRQCDIAALAFAGRMRLAVLQRGIGYAPGFADLRHTVELFREGQSAASAFASTHMGPRRSVRPGRFESDPRAAGSTIRPEPAAFSNRPPPTFSVSRDLSATKKVR
jgi:NTE family protein